MRTLVTVMSRVSRPPVVRCTIVLAALAVIAVLAAVGTHSPATAQAAPPAAQPQSHRIHAQFDFAPSEAFGTTKQAHGAMTCPDGTSGCSYTITAKKLAATTGKLTPRQTSTAATSLAPMCYGSEDLWVEYVGYNGFGDQIFDFGQDMYITYNCSAVEITGITPWWGSQDWQYTLSSSGPFAAPGYNQWSSCYCYSNPTPEYMSVWGHTQYTIAFFFLPGITIYYDGETEGWGAPSGYSDVSASFG